MQDVWNHLSENGMATNAHPFKGGIIDKVAMSMKLTSKEEWFIVFNHPGLPVVVDGLSSKAEAFEVFEKVMHEMALTTLEIPNA